MIYIQKDNGEFIGEFAYNAWVGFKWNNERIEFFEDIETVPEGSMIVGRIDVTIQYLKRVGVTVPLPMNIPKELEGYSGREINITTLGEFKLDTTVPIFVKPYSILKLFDGGVLTQNSTKRLLFDYPDDTLLMTSEVVEIDSEYRVFILNKEILGIKHYLGDSSVFPNIDVIKSTIKDFKSSPVGYTLDFGITKDRGTILIEANDGWSIGSYGLDPLLYVRLLKRRWLEMITLS